MTTIAHLVRESNVHLFAPEQEFAVEPELLSFEPTVYDSYMTPDGRQWVRVYGDGSALDQHGIVHPRAPALARDMANRHGEWKVA